MELVRKIGRLLKSEPLPAPAFQAHCRKFSRKVAGRNKKTVLISQYTHATTIYANSLVARACQENGITPRSFHFESKVSSRLNSLYESFGASLALSPDSARKFEGSARTWATRIANGLQTKQDLLEVEIDGIKIGHLVYDSCLRSQYLATIDLGSPRVRRALQSAAEIFWNCAEYFDRHDVRAVIPDHFVYNRCGIISQLAWRRGIPLLFYRFQRPFYIFRLPREEPSPVHLQVPYQHPFDHYPEFFSALSPEQQKNARARAETALRNHLSGRRKNMIFGGHSAYAEGGDAPLFPNDGKPRILILLHDFCDAPHVFGSWIFPDFYEWIHHLLRRARDTRFRWIVKPHPNLQTHGRDAMGEANWRVIEDLKKEYPDVQFLEPGTSNLQVINEGIDAMFTGYGSAGHEFAYFGIPVVNAAPNPHLRYDFNLHARSVEEYDEYIRIADRLNAAPNKERIAEFYYMYNFYLSDTLGAPFEILPQDILTSPERLAKLDQFAPLDECVRTETASFRAQFSGYLEKSLSSHLATSPAEAVA